MQTLWSKEETRFLEKQVKEKGIHPRDLVQGWHKKFKIPRTSDAMDAKLKRMGIQYQHLLREAQKRQGPTSKPEGIQEQVSRDIKEKSLKRELALLNQKYSELARGQAVGDRAVALLQDIAPRLPKIEFAWERPTGRKTKETAILLLGDTHIGETVDKEEVMGLGEYNLDVFARRMKFLAESIKSITVQKLTGYTIDKLIIMMMGDMITGLIHEDIMTGGESMVVQVLQGAYVTAQFILEMQQLFPEVEVEGVLGNHGRLFQKKRYKRGYDNWDYIFYQFVSTFLAINTQIKCNFPKGPFLIRKIYDWGFLVLHGDDIRCFLPGSPVSLHNWTTKNIEDVVAGDRVLCSDGKNRAVNSVFKYGHKGEISVIEALGLPKGTLRVTPNHQILFVPAQKVSNPGYSDPEPEWVKAGYISKGDYLVIPKPDRIVDGSPIITKNIIPDEIRKRAKKHIPGSIEKDFGLGYVIGQYLADGSASGENAKRNGDNYDNILEVCYNSEEVEYWNDFISHFKNSFGNNISPSLLTRKDMAIRCQRLHVYSQEVCSFIKLYAGKGSNFKVLNDKVMSWPQKALKGILVGYLRGDGHTRRRKYHRKYMTHSVVATTSSEQLGRQLFWLARACGYTPCIKTNVRSGKPEIRLSFYGDDARALGPITQRNYKTEDFTETQFSKTIKFKDFILAPVTKAHRESYEGLKYDLSIEEKHDYTVNHAVVHNSWMGIPWYGIQRAMWRLGDLLQGQGIKVHFRLIGHFHNTGEIDRTPGEIIINGSMIGGTEYSLKRFMEFGRPTQLFMGCHKDIGITWRYPLRLDLPGVDLITPYVYNVGDSTAGEQIQGLMEKTNK